MHFIVARASLFSRLLRLSSLQPHSSSAYLASPPPPPRRQHCFIAAYLNGLRNCTALRVLRVCTLSLIFYFCRSAAPDHRIRHHLDLLLVCSSSSRRLSTALLAALVHLCSQSALLCPRHVSSA
ncbi:hypothetical protein R3P38DRAFT_2904333 [Favolaschia claudopus]|uniref:Uncharacterized protein n=1 Tax=Favolaschia claudopus TaxID=2862362 RepID=A0AAW0CDD9_9AGAR